MLPLVIILLLAVPVFTHVLPAVLAGTSPDADRLPERSTPERVPQDVVDALDPADVEPEQPDDCLIKGNISIDTGEAIYHVPGQKYYEQTVIDERYGELWFCTEDEALAAGWRKSKV